MKTLTVFTPTYNRAYCLGQCYDSLVKQTSDDFIWLIIDDGSSDNTKELVDSWIHENKIQIEYKYQQNQGMHGAHNTAYDVIKTELNVCIDSDDFMAEGAVEKIISFWNSTPKDSNIAGIIGLDAFKNGEVIGKRIPSDLNKTTLEDLYHKHKIYGDKKLVLRTDVVNKYPRYPIYAGERFVPLGILYLLIDKDYQMLCLDEVLCVVEYMEDGSSRNILKQYRRHPNGFRYARTINMKHSKYFKVRLKNTIHFFSHSLQLKDWAFFGKSPLKLLTLITMPIGFVLYLYILYVNKVKK